MNVAAAGRRPVGAAVYPFLEPRGLEDLFGRLVAPADLHALHWPDLETLLASFHRRPLTSRPVSNASKRFFASRPPAKPVSLPVEPITRWHG